MQKASQAGWQARFALFVGEARVGGAQEQVGDQAIELPIAGLDDDEAAFLDLLRRDGEAHLQALFQPPPTTYPIVD